MIQKPLSAGRKVMQFQYITRLAAALLVLLFFILYSGKTRSGPR